MFCMSDKAENAEDLTILNSTYVQLTISMSHWRPFDIATLNQSAFLIISLIGLCKQINKTNMNCYYEVLTYTV